MENETLYVTLILVSIVTSIALFVNWAGNKHIPGLLSIAVGFVVLSAGVLFLTMQGSVTPFLSVIAANSLLMGGRVAILFGLASFWNQEKSRIPILCSGLLIIAVAALTYFTLFDDNMIWRIRAYSLMVVVLSLCNIFVIANGLHIERKLRPVMTISSNFGAFLALMLFSFNAVTEFILMFLRTGAVGQSTDEGTSFLLLGSIFTLIVLAFAIIIMTMEELSVEHKENAIYDPITTILNHRTFMEVGQRIMGVALRYSKPVSLLSIEVANMDEVVRTHGYKVGNEMLRHLSLMASDRRRNEDVLARSSFREFRLLLPGVDEEGSKVVIEKIKNALLGEDFIYRGKKLDVDVNIAAVTRREEELNMQQLLQEGEVALYRVKQAAAATS